MTLPTAPAPAAPSAAAQNGAPAPVTEAPKAGEAAPPDAQVSKAWAALAKKEKGLAAQSHKLAQEKAELQSVRAELDAYKKSKEAALRDPHSFQKSVYGDDWYDKMTEWKLSGGKVTPELVSAHVDQKLEDFQKRQDAERQKQADAEKQRVAQENEQALANWRDEVIEVVKAGAEYELINSFEAYELVLARIQREYEKTKKVMSAKEAADAVEKDFEERTAKTKKFQKAPVAPQAPDKRNETPQRRTLSNDMAGSSAALAVPPAKTDAERRQRALAAMDAVQRQRKAS